MKDNERKILEDAIEAAMEEPDKGDPVLPWIIAAAEPIFDNAARDAKVKAAIFYREKIEELLDLAGAGPALPCRSCGKRVRFLETKTGKKAPITVDGFSHFIDCPGAKEHRKR